MGVIGYALLLLTTYLIGISISDWVIPLIQKSTIGGSIVHPTADWWSRTAGALKKENSSAAAASGNDYNNIADQRIINSQEGLDQSIIYTSSLDTALDNIRFVIHRNGEASPCGHTVIPFSEAMVQFHNGNGPNTLGRLSLSSSSDESSLSRMDKYELDHFLTSIFGKYALPLSSCGVEEVPFDIQGPRRKTWGRGEDYNIDGVDSQFLTFCDMGQDHTTILPDHDRLLEIYTNNVNTLPCHFHTREGLRFTSFDQLVTYANQQRIKAKQIQPEQPDREEEAEECVMSEEDGTSVCQSTTASSSPSPDSIIMADVHLYAVPAGRPFVFAPSFVGEIFDISHVQPQSEKPISLKVMSVSPRVFDILNFFDTDESDAIVKKALAETSETHRIKRSSTGASGYNLNSQRTSENGFDTHGETAIIVKKRCMEVLGFDEYIESFTDGLQVLRYNQTTAYIPHMDWIDDPHKKEMHNYDSAGQGTNRFATILLYMSDLGEGDGGETVFKHAWPLDVPEDQRKSRAQALEELRSSGDASELQKDSWQELMVADCRSRLAVRPQSARAVLFYSQHPNGEEDTSSLHGGCPVLHGQKWAANLWVWNGPRGGFHGAPMNPGKERKEDDNNYEQIHVTFVNTGKDPLFKEAKLYFQDSFWGDFSHGDPPLSVNTYVGHQWNIRRISDNTLLKQIVIPSDKKSYKFEV